MSQATVESTATGIPTPEELGFNPADLRKKYANERDRRIRTDGNNQYQEIAGQHLFHATLQERPPEPAASSPLPAISAGNRRP